MTAQPQPVAADRHLVAKLKHLLLLAGRAVDRDGGAVTEAGQAIELCPQLAVERPGLVRCIILQVEVDLIGGAPHADLADHVAGRGAGRAQRQPHIEAGQVAGDQQRAFGGEAVEYLAVGEPRQDAPDLRLAAPGVAADPDRSQLGVQDFEVHDAVLDALRRHLDGGEIALTAQDRRGGVANVADDADRSRRADQAAPRRVERRRRDRAEVIERRGGERDGDRRIGRVGQRAGAALDVPLDGKARWRRRGGTAERLDRFTGRRCGGGALGQRRAGQAGEGGQRHEPDAAPPPRASLAG